MEEVLLFATVLLPIVTALVELIKKVVGLIIGAVATPFTDFDIVLRLWAGGLAGLAGTGLFELVAKKRPGQTKEGVK